ncbi:MAG: ribonuclease R [Luteibaculaceae bacterium]
MPKQGTPHKSDARKNLAENILKIFKNSGNQVFNYKQIARKLGVKDAITRSYIASELAELTEKELIEEIEVGRYRSVAGKDELTGTLDFTKQGDAYFICEELKEDLFIKKVDTGNAFQGDLVTVTYSRGGRRGRPRPYVKEIVSRAKTTFTGIVQVSKKFAFVVPDSNKVRTDFYIAPEHLNGAKNGEKVAIELISWDKNKDNPEGKITQVFGLPGEHFAEMNAIIDEFNLPTEFPTHVEQAAEKIPVEIKSDEIGKRRDMRKTPTFTIDPFDAKDFDDALSIVKLEDGNYEIGIHIADVTHYVKEGDVIWKEAEFRATSIYLVDRVIPMLPEVLSNNLCSLRPNEEKLTYSVVVKMNDKAEIKDVWIGKTVIESDKRFTYEEAQEIIEGAEGEFKWEILTLNSLAKIMRAERLKHGALNFGGNEVKFKLDEKGKPIEVYEKQLKESNNLIEEFMLLANKKVAERIGKPGDKNQDSKVKTFVYRVHEQPNPEKTKQFSTFVYSLGYKLKHLQGRDFSVSINKLLAEVKDKPEFSMISMMAVRSMEKAYYTTNNQGHFGLAFEHYSHFTSPIRRFPDMIAHKLLFEYAAGAKSADGNQIERLCKHSSEMEKRAAEAERASIKFKQMEYLKERVGEEFDGAISGLTGWGMYVVLDESRCEGMVSIRSIDGDEYYFNEDSVQIIGRRYKQAFKMGMGVRIKILHVDLIQKQADFELISWDDTIM